MDFDDVAPIDDQEDAETLAAIDEGIRDGENGRTTPIDDVRTLLPRWIAGACEMLDTRCEDVRSGRVTPLDGEAFFRDLHRLGEALTSEPQSAG